jgi:hypothetical protein
MKRFALAIMVCILACGVASDTWAQKLEITFQSGYRFGGGFSEGDISRPGSPADGLNLDDLEIDDSPTVGITIDLNLAPSFALELSYDRQETSLKLKDGSNNTAETIFDLGIDYLQLGFVLQAPSGTVRPFFSFLIGTTYFNPQGVDAESETRASGGIGLGFKAFASDAIGLRFQGRVISTFLSSSNEVFCDENGFCYSYPSSTYMFQGDVSVGLIIAF